MILTTKKPSELPRFDPEKHEHRAAYATFIVTGNWPMKFYVEVPQWQNMYDMVRAKMAEHACAPIIRKMRRDAERKKRREEREAEEKVKREEALNQLAELSQELGMYGSTEVVEPAQDTAQ